MASMALTSTTSFGQEEGDVGTIELSPLSVTGTKAAPSPLSSGLKTSLPVDSLPKSISIMDADQIKAQGLKSVGDVIDHTPGVTNSQGEGHRDAAVIRGVRTTQDFYRDGIRDDVQYYRPLYNIEQVEVIRGSDALLSGFGGAYGLINRVSKRVRSAKTSQWSMEASILSVKPTYNWTRTSTSTTARLSESTCSWRTWKITVISITGTVLA